MTGGYHFGIAREALTPSEIERRQRIAKRHGAEFIWLGIVPGCETRGYFSAPNRGEPFDRALASAVAIELAEGGAP